MVDVTVTLEAVAVLPTAFLRFILPRMCLKHRFTGFKMGSSPLRISRMSRLKPRPFKNSLVQGESRSASI